MCVIKESIFDRLFIFLIVSSFYIKNKQIFTYFQSFSTIGVVRQFLDFLSRFICIRRQPFLLYENSSQNGRIIILLSNLLFYWQGYIYDSDFRRQDKKTILFLSSFISISFVFNIIASVRSIMAPIPYHIFLNLPDKFFDCCIFPWTAIKHLIFHSPKKSPQTELSGEHPFPDREWINPAWHLLITYLAYRLYSIRLAFHHNNR